MQGIGVPELLIKPLFHITVVFFKSCLVCVHWRASSHCLLYWSISEFLSSLLPGSWSGVAQHITS